MPRTPLANVSNNVRPQTRSQRSSKRKAARDSSPAEPQQPSTSEQSTDAARRCRPRRSRTDDRDGEMDKEEDWEDESDHEQDGEHSVESQKEFMRRAQAVIRAARNDAAFQLAHFQVEPVRRMLLGHDGIVMSATGSGKSMLMELAARLRPDMTFIVVSPLRSLQEEQASKFKGTTIKAINLDAETLSGRREVIPDLQSQSATSSSLTEEERRQSRRAQLLAELKRGAFNLIFASPETLISNSPVSHALSQKSFRTKVGGIFIDEAHVVDEWGTQESLRTKEAFRPDFGKIRVLRHLVGARVPVLACTATLPSSTLKTAWRVLDFGRQSFFACDAGTDRPNIRLEVRAMSYSNTSFRDLASFFSPLAKQPEHIPKTIIYVRTKHEAYKAAEAIKGFLDPCLASTVCSFTSLGTNALKTDVLQRFYKTSGLRILVATEAGGMGLDVADVDLIIQFRLSRTLTEFFQHAGRAVRQLSKTGVAVLLAESWAFESNNIRNNLTTTTNSASQHANTSHSAARGTGGDEPSSAKAARRAKVEPALLRFVQGGCCRRAVVMESMRMDFEWMHSQLIESSFFFLASPHNTVSPQLPFMSDSSPSHSRMQACLWIEPSSERRECAATSCCDVCVPDSPLRVFDIREIPEAAESSRSIRAYRFPRPHAALSPLRLSLGQHLLDWRHQLFQQRRTHGGFLPSPESVLSDLSVVRIVAMAGRIAKLGATYHRFDVEPLRQLLGTEADILPAFFLQSLSDACFTWARQSTAQDFAKDLTNGGDWREKKTHQA